MFALLCGYFRRIISTITMVATIIVIMMPMVAGSKYMSAIDAGVDVGGGVVVASSTFIAVRSYDGQ